MWAFYNFARCNVSTLAWSDNSKYQICPIFLGVKALVLLVVEICSAERKSISKSQLVQDRLSVQKALNLLPGKVWRLWGLTVWCKHLANSILIDGKAVGQIESAWETIVEAHHK